MRVASGKSSVRLDAGMSGKDNADRETFDKAQEALFEKKRQWSTLRPDYVDKLISKIVPI